MFKKAFTYINEVGFLIVGIFFLFLIDLLNFGDFFGYMLLPFILLKSKSLKENIDGNFFVLCLLSLTYGLFYALDPVDGIQLIIVYSTFLPAFYMLGKFFINPVKEDKYIFYLLFISAAIYSLPVVVSVYQNFIEGGFVQVDRSIPYIWTDEPLSATVMGAYLTLNMVIPALLVVGRKAIPNVFKIIMIVLFVFSLICSIRLGSRTQLSVFLITSIVAVIYMLRRQSAKQNAILLLLLVGIVVFVLNTISFDLNEDWLTSFASRMEGKGNNAASAGGRTERWVKSFEYLFKKPLGWDLKEFGYSHNLWLDVLRAGGIIPFVLLIVFSVRSFFQIRKTLRSTDNIFINGLIYIYALAFFLIFMVEPIFDAAFSLFALFCLFIGVINKYYELKTT
ncbi:MAG: hypothetical protein ED555_13800 [Allomuricauda sp.]|nr:MAG: hypothetical protein ED555_13800 [Allomuricauda sp.]